MEDFEAIEERSWIDETQRIDKINLERSNCVLTTGVRALSLLKLTCDITKTDELKPYQRLYIPRPES
jgi:hypothetical protein